MSVNWVLLLLPSDGDAARKVGGLTLALRLALDAQAAGAKAIIDTTQNPDVTRTLGDPRLGVPLLPNVPEGARPIAVPANWLMHRSTFATLLNAAPANDTQSTSQTLLRAAPLLGAFHPIR